MGANRIDKINSELKKDIYEAITRKIKNPLITEMVSVTDVKTSKDLSYAKVYISIFSVSAEKKQTTFNAIVSDAKKIRHEVAKSARFFTVPELHFLLDDSMEYGDKMDKLLSSINKGEQN